MFAYGLLQLAFLYVYLYRSNAARRAGIPPGEQDARVKGGRWLPMGPLGTVTLVAMVVSAIYQFSYDG